MWMLKVYRSAMALLVALLLCCAAATVRKPVVAGATGVKASEEFYDRVMDIVFPREVLTDRKVRFVFVLRYQPTFQPESQIVIVRRQDRIEVTTYRSLDGSIETKVDERNSEDQHDPEQFAKQFRVEKRSLAVTEAEAGKLHRDFFEALRVLERKQVGVAPSSIGVTADGTVYRFWYAGKTDIQGDLHGSGVTRPNEPGEPLLMEWMKRMRRRFLS